MKTSIQKWGNSLAVRIPAVVAKEVNLKEGSNVELSLANNTIFLKPVPEVPEYSLDELLSAITEENIHPETPTGSPVGREEW